MSSWSSALAPAVVAALVLLVPGLLVGRAAGLRGLLWLGVAPALSVTVVSLAAVAAPVAGWGWGPRPLVVATAVAAAAAVPVGLLAGRPVWRRAAWPTRPSRRDATIAAATGAGALLGGALATRRLLRAIASPSGVSQSFDEVFHLNAVRWILDHHDGSSMHLGQLTAPARSASFYPAGWHDVVALAVMATGSPIEVATNATAVVVAVVVWPLGVLAAVRALLGRRPIALAAAAVLPAAMLAQPVVDLDWGVLYPTVLTNSLVPATLGLVVVVVDRARRWRLRVASALVVAATLPGTYLAQPSGLFVLAVIGLPLGIGVVAGWARRTSRRPGPAGAPLAALGVAAAIAGTVSAWHVVDTMPSVVSARRTDWAARASVSGATWQAVTGGYLNRPANWLPAALIVIGVVIALRRPRWRWVVGSHLLVSFLYVMAWSVDSDLSQQLTGFWYNDAYRLAALPVITGVVLASAGAAGLASFLARLSTEQLARRLRATALAMTAMGVTSTSAGPMPASTAAPLRPRTRSARYGYPVAAPSRRWAARQLLAAAAVVVVVLAGAHGAAFAQAYASLAANYANSPDTTASDLLDADERTVMDRVDAHVPPGVAVAGNPWNGSALVYALADRPTPFAHMVTHFDAPRAVVAAHLREAASDPAVCPAVRALHLGYVLDFGTYYLWGGDSSHRDLIYPGLDDLAGAPGFTLVDSQGDARLYRITACGAPA